MLLTKEGPIYRCGELSLAPYPTERILAEGYLRFEQEGTLDLIYHHGGTHSLAWFLTQFVKEQNAILALCKNNAVIGFAWFNYLAKIGSTEFKKAEAGIGFFRKTHPRDALLAAAMGTDWAFRELGLDVMFGVTPEPNKAAVRFLERLGRDTFGPIPMFTTFPFEGGHQPCGAYISTMTTVKWQDIREQWFYEGDFMANIIEPPWSGRGI